MESASSIQLAVLDDDPIFLEYISAMLGHDGDMEITQTSDGPQLLRALKGDPIDCVLVDYNLGTENGLNIAEAIRATIPNAPPIVMLTGGGSERTAVKAFRSGFSDYVSKRDLNKHELVTAIRSAVGTRKKAQSETIEADLIKKRLQFDNVTGLYGAQFMQERLGEFTGRGAPSAFGVVLIKLRNLAQIRASLGHIAGDRLLHNFAKRLNLATHAGDLCGSLGDDGFLYLIDRDVNARAISQCCRRLAQEPGRVLEEISSNTPDLILLDMHMPVADGMEVAQIIRQSRRNLSLPIIFLSAEQDVERQRQARKLGGDDFINKSVGFDHLASLVRMRAERAVALRQIGERDSLTGLLNHARFKDRVAVELERCRRTGSQFSVCLLDIDHFKQVNDTKGHQVGDRVIQTLSHSLVGGLRHIDVVARYGGEEFGVILLDTPIEPSNAVMNRIREHFADIPMRGPDEPFHVTFSAGVAGADAGKSADELIAAADAALYEAKRSGRNRVVSAKS
ncbi:diguanylate cyclase [Aurantimonas sp. C2-6-R+9]|uniref:GGDEF domain-containing response regulator n=1 Tax=unclassified Aurantimonas TaxID=2638230 RepID=UPI002E1900F7|nr:MULTISPECIES: diguanylate cyclase [unclassified Aurantimonas]MEC5289857.1 diguanylate cyclase [Aurantimonas sp. C2-3-R2]MEC5380002.1 diguanylate cyclase [Aurantimonas sp. C2-6-R+9]MEC5410939.1 diguanylate cyclase [Aurantimonas sp. C2-4-R8]